MERLNSFLNEVINDHSEDTIKTYVDFYNRLEKNFPEKESIDFTLDDFKSIFVNLNTKTVHSFTTAKNFIKYYFVWMVKNNYMTSDQLEIFLNIKFKDIDLSKVFQNYYFRNFYDLYSSLEEAINYHSPDSDGEFSMIRCAAYLAWYGVKCDELIDILKSDISKTTSVIYVGNPKRKINVSERCMREIIEYSERESFGSKKFGRDSLAEIRYKPSQYLFRTCKSSHLRYDQICTAFKYINKYSDDVGKRFNYAKIYQSGMYYRAYQDEQDNGIIQKNDFVRLVKLFGNSYKSQNEWKAKSYSYNELKQYLKYKEIFNL